MTFEWYTSCTVSKCPASDSLREILHRCHILHALFPTCRCTVQCIGCCMWYPFAGPISFQGYMSSLLFLMCWFVGQRIQKVQRGCLRPLAPVVCLSLPIMHHQRKRSQEVVTPICCTRVALLLHQESVGTIPEPPPQP